METIATPYPESTLLSDITGRIQSAMIFRVREISADYTRRLVVFDPTRPYPLKPGVYEIGLITCV